MPAWSRAQGPGQREIFGGSVVTEGFYIVVKHEFFIYKKNKHKRKGTAMNSRRSQLPSNSSSSTNSICKTSDPSNHSRIDP